MQKRGRRSKDRRPTASTPSMLPETATPTTMRSSRKASPIRTFLSRAERARRFGIDCTESFTWAGGEWAPGGEYKKLLRVKNVSGKMQRIKYALPKSQHFSMDFPKLVKMPAGMEMTFDIVFRPVRFERYDDVVGFTSERGTFEVPISARLAELAVEVPEAIDFGCCPVTEVSSRTFTVVNSGEVPSAFTWAVETPFAITPRTGLIDAGSRSSFTVTFAPKHAMKWHSTAVCTFEDGDGDEGGEAQPTVCSVRLEGVGKFPFLRCNKRELQFGSVEVDGQRVGELEFILENPTRVPAKFVLARVLNGSDGGAAPDHFSFRLTRNQVGPKIESGLVAPMNSTRIFATFSPLLVGLCSRETFTFTTPCGNKATLKCVGTSTGSFTAVWRKARNAAPAASTKFGSATAARAISDADVDGDGNLTTRELADASAAVGLPCSTTAALNFGDVAVGSTLRLTTILDNRSKIPSYFQILADPNGVFQFPQPRGILPPCMQSEFAVAFAPTAVGNFFKRVYVLLQDGDPSCVALDLIGTAFKPGQTVRPAQMRLTHLEKFRRRQHEGLGRLAPNEIDELFEQLEAEGDHARIAELERPVQRLDGTTRSGEAARQNVELIENLFNPSTHEMMLSCEEICFGSTSLRGEPPKRTVQVTNHTHAKVTLTWCSPTWKGDVEGAPNPFSIFPLVADIPAGRSVEFRVAYRPTEIGALHTTTLEAFVAFKVQRNFRLVNDVSFAPPWALPLRVLGHTFSQSAESFLPRVDFNLRKKSARLPSCHVGDTVYTTIRMDNNGHTPVMFQFKPDASGTFAVQPTGGVVPRESFQIFMVSFTPSEAVRYRSSMECVLNDGAATKAIPLDGIGYLPEVEIVEGEELWFKPTSIGMASVRAMTVRNKSRVPLRFKWEIPAKFASTLAVRDAEGSLLGMEATRVRWRFSPQQEGPQKLWAMCLIYSGGDGVEPERVWQKVVTHFHGQGRNNSLVRFEPMQVDFGTALVGSSASQTLRLINGSNSKLRYELVVRRVDAEAGEEATQLVTCDPPIDELQARSSATVQVKFTPTEPGEYRFEVMWDTASDRRAKAMRQPTEAEVALADACMAHEPDMGAITHKLKAAAYTMGGVDLHSLFGFLDVDGGGNLDFPEFLRGMRRSHISKQDLTDGELAWLFSKVDCNGGGEIDAIEFINFVTGEKAEVEEGVLDDNFSVRGDEEEEEETEADFESDKFVGTVGCEMVAQAGYPLVSIDSVCTQSGPSPSWLWQRMSLFGLSAELMSNPKDEETTPFCVAFSPAPPRSAPQVLRIVLRNRSALAVDLSFKFPDDLEVEMEPWADAGEPSKKQLVENAIIDAHLFDIAPRQLSLAPGASATVRFTYDYANAKLADGIHELPVELGVTSGTMKVRTVQLLLCGRTLPSRGRKARPLILTAQPSHTFVAQLIGLSVAPVQTVRIRNASSHFAVDYQFSSEDLTTLAGASYGYDVLRCLNPSGRIEANSEHDLLFIFNPIEAKDYAVRASVRYACPPREGKRGMSDGDYLKNGFVMDLELCGRGLEAAAPARDALALLEMDAQMNFSGSNRTYLLTGNSSSAVSASAPPVVLPPWQPASLDCESIDFGQFPAGARVSQLVIVHCPDVILGSDRNNPDALAGVRFEWDQDLAEAAGLEVTPWEAAVKPGCKMVCKVTYNSTDASPRLLDSHLKCKVWRASVEPPAEEMSGALRPGISRLNSTRGSMMTTRHHGDSRGLETRGSMMSGAGNPDGDWRTISKHRSVSERGTRSGTARADALQQARCVLFFTRAFLPLLALRCECAGFLTLSPFVSALLLLPHVCVLSLSLFLSSFRCCVQ